MGIKQPELGKRQRFEFRTGVGNVPGLGGVNKQKDPGALMPWEFQHLENVEAEGDTIVSRGGQTKVNSGAALDGYILGAFSGDSDTVSEGTSGAAVWNAGKLAIAATYVAAANAEVWFFNEELNSFSRVFVASGSGDASENPLGYSSCAIRAADGGPASELWLTGATPSENSHRIKKMNPSYTAAAPNFPMTMFKLTGTNVGPTSIIHDRYHAGTWYIGFGSNGVADAKVYKWDGKTISTEDAPAIDTAFPVLYYGDQNGEVYAGYSNISATVSTIRRRGPNGTWAALSNSGFGASTFRINVFSQDKNSVKWMGGSKDAIASASEQAILASFTSSTLTLQRSITVGGSGLTIHGNAMAFSVENQVMYYCYSATFGTEICRLGSYTGAAFNDNIKDFITQDSTIRQCIGLAVHNGRLYGLFTTSTSNSGKLMSAALNGLTGTWTAHTSNLPSGVSTIPLPSASGLFSDVFNSDGAFDGGLHLISLSQ